MVVGKMAVTTGGDVEAKEMMGRRRLLDVLRGCRDVERG